MTHVIRSAVKSILVAGVLALAAAPASAQVPLAEEPHINQQLMAAAVGDAIRKTCPSISARMVTVYFKMKELEKASGQAWDQVKDTADKLWDDLKRGVADAHSKFK